jgi:hypothetical protein
VPPLNEEAAESDVAPPASKAEDPGEIAGAVSAALTVTRSVAEPEVGVGLEPEVTPVSVMM